MKKYWFRGKKEKQAISYLFINAFITVHFTKLSRYSMVFDLKIHCGYVRKGKVQFAAEMK